MTDEMLALARENHFDSRKDRPPRLIPTLRISEVGNRAEETLLV